MHYYAHVQRAIEAYKAAGEETRLRILLVLREAGEELCVCEVAHVLGKPQYTVSKSLTVLRRAGLVEERRDGRFMMYKLLNNAFNNKLFESLNNIEEADPLSHADIQRLADRLGLRKDGKYVVISH